MTAQDILDLLRHRHRDDMLFTEIGCGSNGFDRGSGTTRLDAWAMPCSWTKSAYIGYEVKVSRSDFLGDTKWTTYLPSCTQFYFVVAPGVCDKSEIGEQAGLLVASKNCKRLVIKKKAPALVPDHARVFNMLKVALMRTRSRGPTTMTPAEVLAVLEKKEESRLIGHKIGRELAVRARDLDLRAETMKEDLEFCRSVEAALREMGIPLRWTSRFGVDAKEFLVKEIERLGMVPKSTLTTLKRAEKEISKCHELLADLKVNPIAEEEDSPSMFEGKTKQTN